jgi:hypothetical protein
MDPYAFARSRPANTTGTGLDRQESHTDPSRCIPTADRPLTDGPISPFLTLAVRTDGGRPVTLASGTWDTDVTDEQSNRALDAVLVPSGVGGLTCNAHSGRGRPVARRANMRGCA